MNSPAPEDPPIRPLDRLLAFVSVTLIVLAVACFLAIIIATWVGVTDFSGWWVAVSVLMYYGLPLGVVLFFILLIMNMIRRSRAAKAVRGR